MTTDLPVSRTGATDREVEAGQYDDCGLCYAGQRCPGYCAAEGVGSLYDPPARAAAAPDSGQRERVKAACAAYVDSQGDYADRGDFKGDVDELWSYIGPALLAEQPGGGK